MRLTTKAILTTALLIWSVVVMAQVEQPRRFKNEIGIDVANILTFLSRTPESYLVTYKRHLTDRHTLRSGLSLDWSTAGDGFQAVRTRVGYERGHQVAGEQWRLHWGADFSFRYQSNNFQPNRFIRLGISPLIGFSYFPTRRFSISTEVSLNFLHTDFRNPGSFAPEDSANVWDINIGSVGMVMINYHF